MLECSTSRFLQMKDPDVIHPGLFSEDNTTSSEEKVKIIRKIEGAPSALAPTFIYVGLHT